MKEKLHVLKFLDIYISHNFKVIFAPWVLREKNYLHVGDLCPSRDKNFLKVYIRRKTWCALS
jgi:hypothetical protein